MSLKFPDKVILIPKNSVLKIIDVKKTPVGFGLKKMATWLLVFQFTNNKKHVTFITDI